MVNLFVILLVGILKKQELLLELKFSLGCDLERWAVQEFFYMHGDSKFVVSEMQARIKQLYKNSPLLCFCKFLCPVDPKDLCLS